MNRNVDPYADAKRQAHRADPQAFFIELLHTLWGDHEEAQTLAEWRRLCTKVRWYAQDAVECLDHMLANPPPNLAELMQEEGSIMLDSGPGQYTVIGLYREKYLDFLRDACDRFKQILAETAS
jgi:hypothetical protein